MLLCAGTIPEIVKLSPVVRALAASPGHDLRFALTGQHPISPNVLSLLGDSVCVVRSHTVPRGTLAERYGMLLRRAERTIRSFNPDVVIVQGDTSSANAVAQAAAFSGVRLVHVEAGLRTGHNDEPFPEEFHRKSIAQLADMHCAPTNRAKRALLAEGVPSGRVFLTGNTVVDAVRWAVRQRRFEQAHDEYVKQSGQHILVCLHRRESLASRIPRSFQALRGLVERVRGLHLWVVAYGNPAVRSAALASFCGARRVRLIRTLPYLDFLAALSTAAVVVTDSGGVQEEAAQLERPMLVVRSATERPETLEYCEARLVNSVDSSQYEWLRAAAGKSVASLDSIRAAAAVNREWGDGSAGARVASVVSQLFDPVAAIARKGTTCPSSRSGPAASS